MYVGYFDLDILFCTSKNLHFITFSNMKYYSQEYGNFNNISIMRVSMSGNFSTAMCKEMLSSNLIYRKKLDIENGHE